MALTVRQLLDLQLGGLKSAVDDWGSMARRLRALATGTDGDAGAEQLDARARGADWSGVNADVGRGFVTRTAAEFNDAATAARSVHAVLRDAHSGLTRHQDALASAVADATRRNIHVNDKGGAQPPSAPPGVVAQEDRPEGPTKNELAAVEQHVARILREADETDRVAARALRALARDRHDFAGRPVAGLKDAAARQGAADAAYWAEKIARGDVADWSDDELGRFNETLALQRGNSAFTEAFAVALGGRGTLEFWRDLASPEGGVDSARSALLGDTQDHLSMTLASATHSESPAMDAWKRDVISAGGTYFPGEGRTGTGPYGFQIMSSLMNKGKYESGYLHDYGEELVEFERRYPADPEVVWRSRATLDHPPTGAPNDPMAGYLEALGHNPEASLRFFNESTGGGRDGLARTDNFDYLVGNGDDVRAWPPGEDGEPVGHDNLGHALESATLGYAYDARNPTPPPLDSAADIEAREARTALTSRIVDHYGSAETIDAQPGVRDSLARIAAGHVDSISYTMANFGGSGELTDRDGLFDAEGRRLADFGQSDTVNFLTALASEKSSYDTVSAAQQAYTSSLMAAQGNRHDDAIDAGMAGTVVHGLLDEARTEAIGKQYADEADERNRELEKQGEWRSYAVGASVAVVAGAGAALVVPAAGAAAVVAPLAFDASQGAAETAWATNTIDWLNAREYDNSQEATEGIQRAQREGENNAMASILNYAEANNVKGDGVRRLVERAAENYGQGARYADTQNSRK
ncbi:hypothetical protein DSC45_07285 [Streptomyces sp. YIM 130001]|uniref:hypothetical protein n=1 Tax=Streptomyces sp. YIM 130001 TaxID=2259644 RepID=UPI000E646E33|nr:hypothetical protein [Streptomyces sp. YIM 130001]RII19797.1 hypothetical protein DSC45_07285 [Streptomyces sp. YIM 130001]